MSWNNTGIRNNNFFFGFDKEGKTFIFGNPNGRIEKIFIEDNEQFADNDFSSALHRFGEINEIKNSDFQEAIINIFNSTKSNK